MPVAKTGAQQVAKLLREYARRTALRGGNPYRAKAYARAADSIAALVEPLDRIVAEDRLTDVPGIGEAIADIVAKLHRTGTHPSLEKLRKEVPDGVLELLSVPGLKPEKALRLHNDLGISSIAELEAAAKDDRIRKAKGLGAALQTKILQNLAIARSGAGRLHIHRAAALLQNGAASLKAAHPKLKRITIAGDFRRGCELVGDMSIVAERSVSKESDEDATTEGLKVRIIERKRFGAALLFDRIRRASGRPASYCGRQGFAARSGRAAQRPRGGRRRGEGYLPARSVCPISNRNSGRAEARSNGR
jgi:DNA polymerase (family 10)